MSTASATKKGDNKEYSCTQFGEILSKQISVWVRGDISTEAATDMVCVRDRESAGMWGILSIDEPLGKCPASSAWLYLTQERKHEYKR